MATDYVSVDEGSITKLPTYSFTEDAVTKEIPRSVLNKSDGTELIGQQLAASSLPVVLTAIQVSTLTPPAAITGFLTESDFDTKTGSLTETAPATDTASSGINGRLQRIAQRLTSLIALIPASLGQKADAASLAVTISTEGTAQLGSITESAPASDTASSGLNGRLQRIAQRLTSLIALHPTSLGQKSDANSLAVTISTEGTAQLGSLTETAPTTDTASSGINGRLQRIAQRITSLIALLPAALGSGGGLKVDGSGTALPVSGTVAISTALALDATLTTTNTEIGGLTETAPATDTASSGLNGRLQRIAQRLTSLITLLPSALGSGGGLKIDGSGTALPVSLTSTTVTNAGTFPTQVSATTTGGYTPGHLVSAGTTNATVIKASAGTLGFLAVSNVNAAARYIKLYNKATAPTVGSDTPVLTFIVPGNTAGAGTNLAIPTQGIAFSTGISFALTTEATDAGSTGVTASELVVSYGFN